MKIAVLGAAGRMGQALTRVLVETPGCVVAGGIEARGSPHIGRDIGEAAGLEPIGIAITDDSLQVFAHVDGVPDPLSQIRDDLPDEGTRGNHERRHVAGAAETAREHRHQCERRQAEDDADRAFHER